MFCPFSQIAGVVSDLVTRERTAIEMEEPVERTSSDLALSGMPRSTLARPAGKNC